MSENIEIVLSICISSFNRGKIVFDNVKYMLQYPYEDIEIVVSDNASEDNTLELLQTISDKRLKVFENEENLGATRNVSRALKRGTGKYICPCNDRDSLEPHKIKPFIEFLKRNSYYFIINREVLGKSRVVNVEKEAELAFQIYHPTCLFYLRTEFLKGIESDSISDMQEQEIYLRGMQHKKRSFLTKQMYLYNQAQLTKIPSWRKVSKINCERSKGQAYFSYEARKEIFEKYFLVIKQQEVLLYKGVCKWFLDTLVIDRRFEDAEDFKYVRKRYHYTKQKQPFFIIIARGTMESIKKSASEGVKNKDVYTYIIRYVIHLLIDIYIMKK